MSTRRMLLIAGALALALTVTVFLVRPTMLSGAEAGPGPVKAQYPEYVERALADLAERLGVAADTIAVVSAEPQTWNDASLGLPEPGMMYAQVITAGHVVTLSCGGETYVYHVAGDTAVLAP